MKGLGRVSAVVVVWVAALLAPATAQAQCEPETPGRPIFLVSGRYDVPLRALGAVGILLPVGLPTSGDLGCAVKAHEGVMIEAGAGRGGVRFAGGFANRVKATGEPVIFGQDVLVTFSRTGETPRKASAHSTYVGAEGGLTLVMVRFSVGVARRVSGAEGPSATIFTWSVGLHTGW